MCPVLGLEGKCQINFRFFLSLFFNVNIFYDGCVLEREELCAFMKSYTSLTKHTPKLIQNILLEALHFCIKNN